MLLTSTDHTLVNALNRNILNLIRAFLFESAGVESQTYWKGVFWNHISKLLLQVPAYLLFVAVAQEQVVLGVDLAAPIGRFLPSVFLCKFDLLHFFTLKLLLSGLLGFHWLVLSVVNFIERIFDEFLIIKIALVKALQKELQEGFPF